MGAVRCSGLGKFVCHVNVINVNPHALNLVPLNLPLHAEQI
jgi:hypothetical protein